MTVCEVLRIGHRPERDKRITTHVALTARAFGASKVYISNPDSRVIKSVEEVVAKFGGNFKIIPTSNPKKIVQDSNLLIVHLTMFGLSIDESVKKIKDEKRGILFIVGAEKVPPWVFELADYNISIGNQPHSEVAALAIAMNNLHFESYNKEFKGKLSVIPSATHREMAEID
jgi:tRNA (cytidine56-2'-O)-methyltransferase